jgi:transcriptional regulator with XRE-family HTH domain
VSDYEGDLKLPVTRPLSVRRLAGELTARREALKLTPDDVYQATGLSTSTIWRIENAKGTPYRSTVIKLLDLYKITNPKERARLLALANPANQRGGWLRAYADVLPPAYTQLIGFEADARSLHAYESLLIHGLLQTEAYARAVIAAGLPMATDEDINLRVRVRMQRQEILTSPPDESPAVEVVLAEAALWPVVGSGTVMAEQLRALLSLPSTVRLYIIPNAAGAHPGMGSGSFTIMRFPEGEAKDLCYIDTMAGGLFREAEADLARFWAIFDALKGAALTPTESTALIGMALQTHEGR